MTSNEDVLGRGPKQCGPSTRPFSVRSSRHVAGLEEIPCCVGSFGVERGTQQPCGGRGLEQRARRGAARPRQERRRSDQP